MAAGEINMTSGWTVYLENICMREDARLHWNVELVETCVLSDDLEKYDRFLCTSMFYVL